MSSGQLPLVGAKTRFNSVPAKAQKTRILRTRLTKADRDIDVNGAYNKHAKVNRKLKEPKERLGNMNNTSKHCVSQDRKTNGQDILMLHTRGQNLNVSASGFSPLAPEVKFQTLGNKTEKHFYKCTEDIDVYTRFLINVGFNPKNIQEISGIYDLRQKLSQGNVCFNNLLKDNNEVILKEATNSLYKDKGNALDDGQKRIPTSFETSRSTETALQNAYNCERLDDEEGKLLYRECVKHDLVQLVNDAKLNCDDSDKLSYTESLDLLQISDHFATSDDIYSSFRDNMPYLKHLGYERFSLWPPFIYSNNVSCKNFNLQHLMALLILIAVSYLVK